VTPTPQKVPPGSRQPGKQAPACRLKLSPLQLLISPAKCTVNRSLVSALYLITALHSRQRRATEMRGSESHTFGAGRRAMTASLKTGVAGGPAATGKGFLKTSAGMGWISTLLESLLWTSRRMLGQAVQIYYLFEPGS